MPTDRAGHGSRQDYNCHQTNRFGTKQKVKWNSHLDIKGAGLGGACALDSFLEGADDLPGVAGVGEPCSGRGPSRGSSPCLSRWSASCCSAAPSCRRVRGRQWQEITNPGSLHPASFWLGIHDSAALHIRAWEKRLKELSWYPSSSQWPRKGKWLCSGHRHHLAWVLVSHGQEPGQRSDLDPVEGWPHVWWSGF